MIQDFRFAFRQLIKASAVGYERRTFCIVETGKQDFRPGIKDKVVVITGGSSELRKFSRAGSIRQPLAKASRLWAG